MYYIGSTNDVSRRINEHKYGKNTSTKNKRSIVLLHVQKFENLHLARKVEYWIKQQKSRKIVEMFMNGEIKKYQGECLEVSTFI